MKGHSLLMSFLLRNPDAPEYSTNESKYLYVDRCTMPLGVEDNRITAGHMSASSFHGSSNSPNYGRLNSVFSWGARRNSHREYLQVYLGGLAKIKGWATQGRSNANYWVKTYYVSYSRDGASFFKYTKNRKTKVRRF